MGEVADLWATLGARVDQAQWGAADRVMVVAHRRLDGLTGATARFNGAYHDTAGKWRAASGLLLTMKERAELARAGVDGITAAADQAGRRTRGAFSGLGPIVGGVLAAFGGRAAYGALVKFSSTMEDSRDKIAGLLSIAKQSDFTAELANAETLMTNLTDRASTLPGSVSDYVGMLSEIAGPVTDAKLSMKELEDLTVGAAVAALALKIETSQGARDIAGALRGQFNARDQLTRPILEARGFKGEEGRARFNALSESKRAAELTAGFNSPQLKAMAEAQGKSFSGLMSTAGDSVKQFFARVGKPLFDGLSAALQQLNAWFAANAATVTALADTIGGVLVGAFQAVGAVIDFFRDHMELAIAIVGGLAGAFVIFGVAAAAAWLATLWPIFAVAAAIAAVILVVRNLGKIWTWLKSTSGAVWDAFKAFGNRVIRFFTDDIPSAIKSAFVAAFEFIRDLPVVKQIIDAIQWARQKAGAVSEGVGGVLGRVGEAFGVAPAAPALSIIGPPSQQPGATINGGVNVGDIHVTAPAGADTQAVAQVVRSTIGDAIDERLGNIFRRTMDTVA